MSQHIDQRDDYQEHAYEAAITNFVEAQKMDADLTFEVCDKHSAAKAVTRFTSGLRELVACGHCAEYGFGSSLTANGWERYDAPAPKSDGEAVYA